MQATGLLQWERSERLSDRYGVIFLDANGYTPRVRGPLRFPARTVKRLTCRYVHITAKVVARHHSHHVGDRYRGLLPSTPNVGEIVDLGRGRLSTDVYRRKPYFMLWPNDHRKTDWFDPERLFRLHDQLVVLTVTTTTVKRRPLLPLRNRRRHLPPPPPRNHLRIQHKHGQPSLVLTY